MSDKLTCIYPVSHPDGGNTECGFEPPDGTNALVALQEHLRDEHLGTSTEGLYRMLQRQLRWITHPNGTIGMLPGSEPWVEQEYTKIEWALGNGKRWLRAEAQS
jgi:hypothetical protein